MTTSDEADDLVNAFWRFSLRIYGRDGVPNECLYLQDQFGVDVNLALFCLWLGAENGMRLTPERMTEAANAVDGWHDDIVRTLRSARRGLMQRKDSPAADALYIQVKQVELKAEQIEQARLCHLARQWMQDAAAEADTAMANLRVYLNALGHTIDDDRLPAISDALPPPRGA